MNGKYGKSKIRYGPAPPGTSPYNAAYGQAGYMGPNTASAPLLPYPWAGIAIVGGGGALSLGLGQGQTVVDWHNKRVYVPDELVATALDAEDGKFDRKYNGMKIVVKKPDVHPAGAPAQRPGTEEQGKAR